MATPRIDTVYLDMDGVCCDWVGAVLHLFGVRASVEELWKDHQGCYDVEVLLGVSKSKMWRAVDDAGPDFWEQLAPYPWFANLYATASEVGRCFFLTSPSLTPHCVSGKVMWLQKHLGRDFRDYIITPHKYLLARATSLLVDDTDKQIAAFHDHGGRALLFPRPWNHSGLAPSDIIDSLRSLRVA